MARSQCWRERCSHVQAGDGLSVAGAEALPAMNAIVLSFTLAVEEFNHSSWSTTAVPNRQGMRLVIGRGTRAEEGLVVDRRVWCQVAPRPVPSEERLGRAVRCAQPAAERVIDLMEGRACPDMAAILRSCASRRASADASGSIGSSSATATLRF